MSSKHYLYGYENKICTVDQHTLFISMLVREYLERNKISAHRYAKKVGVPRYAVLALVNKTACIDDIPFCDLRKICQFHNIDLMLTFKVIKS